MVQSDLEITVINYIKSYIENVYVIFVVSINKSFSFLIRFDQNSFRNVFRQVYLLLMKLFFRVQFFSCILLQDAYNYFYTYIQNK